MLNRVLFGAFTATAIALPALAAPDLGGRWTVDRALSLATLTAARTISPAEAADVVAMFGKSEIEFAGAKATISMGPQVVTCDWAWGSAAVITLRGCLDRKNMPAPAGPARLELAEDGTLRFFEEDGSALAFRRQG